MRRFVSILLMLVFLGSGSGVLGYVHELQHEYLDAQGPITPTSGSQQHHPLHNDLNCEIHAQLHMPITAMAGLPMPILIGVHPGRPVIIHLQPIQCILTKATDSRAPPAC